MMEHNERHEEILQGLLTGDLDPEAAEARELLEGCAECRTELEGMRALTAELDAAGAFERSVLEEAHGLVDAPGLGDVERVLKMEIAERPAGRGLEAPVFAGPRPAARTRLFTWALALAAAVLAIFVFQIVLSRGGQTSEDELRMGSDAIVLIRPVEPGDGFGTFEWDYDLPPGMSFEVVVVDAAPGAGAEPLHRERDLTETQWTPDEKLTATWRSIRWHVEVIDESGDLDTVAKPATVAAP